MARPSVVDTRLIDDHDVMESMLVEKSVPLALSVNSSSSVVYGVSISTPAPTPTPGAAAHTTESLDRQAACVRANQLSVNVASWDVYDQSSAHCSCITSLDPSRQLAAVNVLGTALRRLSSLAARMAKPRVFVTHCDVPHEGGLNLLKERCELVYFPGTKSLSRAQLLEGVKGADVIIWCTKLRIDKELLDAAGSQLKIIATLSAGYDQIDVAEVKSRGIKIGNTPNVVNTAVAEITIGLMLGAARRFTEGRQKIVESQWMQSFTPDWMLGHEICGSVVGIVGLGGIGQAVVRRLIPFEPSRIVYSGHSRKPTEQELGAEYLPFNDLLKVSDFVVVACPLTEETRNMFSDDAFGKMKPTSVFINIGRGGVVDQPALVKALTTGQIWAAGLDVTMPEPLPADDPLMKLKNLVVVPHLGTATLKTRTAMAKLVAENILAALDGKPMLCPL